MIQFAYLAGLLVGITGMAVIDWRYKLAFWRDRKRTILTLAISIGVFVVWDILGIMLGIFFHGGSKFTLPLRLLPEFPLEELFFCYYSATAHSSFIRGDNQMATYLVLNLVFMAAVYAATYAGFRRPSIAIAVTLGILLVLTAVFDNIIIALSIVGYDPAKILNIYVGSAPIEDFMYAILAVMLVPAIWRKLGGKHAH